LHRTPSSEGKERSPTSANLGHVPKWTSSADAINDSDEIVDTADADVSGVPTTRAFVYMNGSMYNLTFRSCIAI